MSFRSCFFITALVVTMSGSALAQDTFYFQSWSYDGASMLISHNADGETQLLIRDIESGVEEVLSNATSYRCCGSWSRTSNAILYNTYDGNDLDIVLFDVDARQLREVVDNNIHDGGPSPSPTRSEFVYTSVREDNSGAGIFITENDGQNRRAITNLADMRAFNPSWSSDGSMVTFLATVNSNNEVFVINRDGGGERRLTFNSALEYQPRFSPDGSSVMFLSTRDGDWDLYSVPVTGGEPVNLSNDDGDVENFAFSHDGKAIAYDSNESGEYNIYTIRTDGGHKRRLTYLGVPAKYPIFSKDDSWLVIHYKIDNDTHVATLDLPSLQVTSITTDHFSPLIFDDRDKIAFTSYRSGTADIYFVDANRGNLQRITQSEANRSYAERLDAGRKLRFRQWTDNTDIQHIVRDLATGEETVVDDERMTGPYIDQVFNPDSSRVAFREEVGDTLEWFVEYMETGSAERITHNSANREPALLINGVWSNDGRRFAYLNGVDYYNLFLKIYDTETKKTQVVTRRGYMNSGMKWSADDQNIFLNASTREGNYEIYSVDIKNGEMTKLTDTPSSGNLHFDVSPDGEYIVFESQRDSIVEDDAWNSEVYIMRADGTQQIRLTDHEEFDGRPIWFTLPE